MIIVNQYNIIKNSKIKLIILEYDKTACIVRFSLLDLDWNLDLHGHLRWTKLLLDLLQV